MKIIASPYAKKKARDDKIDLTKIVGSGPSGRIIKRDFENITKIVIDYFLLKTKDGFQIDYVKLIFQFEDSIQILQ